jgi:ATP-binding cassette subfamily F protein 3
VLTRLEQVGKDIGGRTLFRGGDLVLRSGDRIGLVGPNGAGKSTLLRMIAGEEACDNGSIVMAQRTTIGLLKQEIDPTLDHSVSEEAASALRRFDELEAELRNLEEQMTEFGTTGDEIPARLAERYDRVSGEFAHGGGFEREARVASVLAGLGFDEAARARPLHSFSGGWLMRVELAKLFLASPDVLLLDEPTNHLDLPAIQWFEETIDAFPGAVVVVSHDRTFLRKHVARVVEIDGTGRFVVYEGNYDRFLEMRDEQIEQLKARKANQDREIAQMERFVERFRAKATKARQAQSRVKALDKIERIELAPDMNKRMRLRIPEPKRSGEIAMRLDDIHKTYGDNPVYEGIGLEISRGDRVALAGPNGAGKSTLLRIIAGALDFDSGTRTPGHNVQIAFFAQHQLEALDPRRSVLEELAADALTEDVPRLRGHLGAFMFSGDDVDKKISVLSGGEKARVALAKMLLRPANLLVLDEPTNHLDIASREVLEDALRQFKGTLVFVSHDRSFINTLATRVIDVAHGVLRPYLGNYDDFLAKRKLEEASLKAVTAPASTPKPDVNAVDAKAPDKPAPRLSKQERAAQRERRKAQERITRRIARLEKEIAESEAKHESLAWQLGSPENASNVTRLQEIQAGQADLQARIDDLYRDWERLADELQALNDAPS